MRGDGKMPHDIAMIHMENPISFKDYSYISTIALADEGDNFEGVSCVIAGWGSTTGNRGLLELAHKNV